MCLCHFASSAECMNLSTYHHQLIATTASGNRQGPLDIISACVLKGRGF